MAVLLSKTLSPMQSRAPRAWEFQEGWGTHPRDFHLGRGEAVGHSDCVHQ